MYLHYVFEDIECEVLESPSTHINNQWFEPHYRRELCEVDYDYEVDVCFKDFFDFIKPFDFDHWKEEGQHAFERACRDVWSSTWFNLDGLEEDEEFIEFMKDRYEDQAREQCQEEND